MFAYQSMVLLGNHFISLDVIWQWPNAILEWESERHNFYLFPLRNKFCLCFLQKINYFIMEASNQ